MKPIFLAILIMSIAFTACQNREATNKIARQHDYQFVMVSDDDNNVKGSGIDSELDFWNRKLENDPIAHTYLLKKAGLLASRFRLKGNIEDIHRSNELLKKANEIAANEKAGIYRALASNAITQHDFKQALEYTQKAYEIGEDKNSTLLLMTDAYIELGNYHQAKLTLDLLQNKTSIGYLIRASKLKDHEGDLDRAIELMEEAFQKIKRTNNQSLYSWGLSKLGDMYGHAGRISESYNSYLKVLNKNPKYYHALKGIAWIAYSHDKDIEDAKKLLGYISQNKKDPQLLLLQAEIAAYEGDEKEKKIFLQEFMQEVSDPLYGNMYNKYLVLLNAEEFRNYDAAIKTAHIEVTNRPTPQSYDLLAWANYKKGNHERAYDIASQYVAGKTFEPETLYHVGAIFKANGMKQEGREYLQEALNSAFELGPLTVKQIKDSLDG